MPSGASCTRSVLLIANAFFFGFSITAVSRYGTDLTSYPNTLVGVASALGGALTSARFFPLHCPRD